MEDMTLEVADALWSVKKIISAIERSSFMIEVLILAVTALVVILTIFLALKLIRTLYGYAKLAAEKVSGSFGSTNFSIKSIPKKIFNFIRNKIPRRR